MIGVGGHNKLAFAQAHQIVLAQQLLHLLVVYEPAALVEFPSDAPTAVLEDCR